MDNAYKLKGPDKVAGALWGGWENCKVTRVLWGRRSGTEGVRGSFSGRGGHKVARLCKGMGSKNMRWQGLCGDK